MKRRTKQAAKKTGAQQRSAAGARKAARGSAARAAEANAKLGQRWLAAFNAHHAEEVVALYADGCTHTSPKIRHLHPDTGGKLLGRAALLEWFNDSLARLPSLRYQALCVTADAERVVLEYLRHVDGQPSYPVAEVLEVANGRVVASRVYHG